jgi:uncharacterized membrane protein YtjA (UPF0391 family)
VRVAPVLLVVGVALLVVAFALGLRDPDDAQSVPASVAGALGFAALALGVWIEAQRFGRETQLRR